MWLEAARTGHGSDGEWKNRGQESTGDEADGREEGFVVLEDRFLMEVADEAMYYKAADASNAYQANCCFFQHLFMETVPRQVDQEHSDERSNQQVDHREHFGPIPFFTKVDGE